MEVEVKNFWNNCQIKLASEFYMNWKININPTWNCRYTYLKDASSITKICKKIWQFTYINIIHKVQGKIKTVLDLKKITLVFRKQSAAKVLFSPKMHFFFSNHFLIRNILPRISTFSYPPPKSLSKCTSSYNKPIVAMM